MTWFLCNLILLNLHFLFHYIQGPGMNDRFWSVDYLEWHPCFLAYLLLAFSYHGQINHSILLPVRSATLRHSFFLITSFIIEIFNNTLMEITDLSGSSTCFCCISNSCGHKILLKDKRCKTQPYQISIIKNYETNKLHLVAILINQLQKTCLLW